VNENIVRVFAFVPFLFNIDRRIDFADRENSGGIVQDIPNTSVRPTSVSKEARLIYYFDSLSLLAGVPAAGQRITSGGFPPFAEFQCARYSVLYVSLSTLSAQLSSTSRRFTYGLSTISPNV